MSDGTDRGAAMTDETLEMLSNVVDFAYQHGYHEHGFPLVESVREELTRLRALSTGEPSPDSAALLDELVESAQREGRTEVRLAGATGLPNLAALPHETRRRELARAAVDAHLVSLHARLTAAERIIKAAQRVVASKGVMSFCTAVSPEALDDLARALPPAGDTRGEQP